jgi:hypothetical protein
MLGQTVARFALELTREPPFTGLHSDAKFRELVHRIGWDSVAAD